MSRKSNQNICDFYKEKSADTITLNYFKLCEPSRKGNEYFGLYEDFVKFSRDPEWLKECQDKDNVSLYRVLQAWEDPESASYPIEIYGKKGLGKLGEITSASQMPDLSFLKGTDIDILNPENNPGEKANQKWHLFVGIFAYSVVCRDYAKYKIQFSRMKQFEWHSNFTMWPCRVLRLWMIENADGQAAEKIAKLMEQKADKEKVKKEINNAFTKILTAQA